MMNLSTLLSLNASEIGQFCLALSLALSVLLAILPIIGGYKKSTALMQTATSLSYALFIICSVAFLLLFWAFYNNLFNIEYVAQNSNSHLPWYYRLTAVWGGHEGSLLLWVWIQTVWIACVARLGRSIPLESLSKVLAVMGFISVGFFSFILFTSSPFELLLPLYPVEGRDLNPLLQDPGLIIHPPMLYMGYVGFSVAFSFAIASLMTGRLDTAWARWSRPWTMAAWIFLTFGITLGSWWAYYELGWGGWWFWDPVENASLMPWLSGTALLHSLSVTEKRGAFKSWTVLLAITTFSLSLLGTFLVRSGVLVSVHSFTSDPTRGLFILSFLTIVIGGSLLLYALRGSKIRSRSDFSLISRENVLFINNLLLISGLLIVLLGTLLPLVHKQLGLGSVSIGKPFFDHTFTFIMIPLALLLGIGPLFRWKRDSLNKNRTPLGSIPKTLLICAVLVLIIASIWISIFGEYFSFNVFVGLFLAFWIILLHLLEVYQRATQQQPLRIGIKKLTRSYWAMIIAHIGLAITIIGVTMTENYSIERDVRLVKGEVAQILDYQFKFVALRDQNGANYSAALADFEIYKNNKKIGLLSAEKRFYQAQQSMMSEAAILPFITHDLYIAMGDKLDTDTWAFRIYYKPFIRWIWGGALFMVIAGLLSITDKRYRFQNIKTTFAPSAVNKNNSVRLNLSQLNRETDVTNKPQTGDQA